MFLGGFTRPPPSLGKPLQIGDVALPGAAGWEARMQPPRQQLMQQQIPQQQRTNQGQNSPYLSTKAQCGVKPIPIAFAHSVNRPTVGF
jgi:hypothetical protein